VSGNGRWDHLVKAGVYPRWFENWPGIEEKAITLRSFQPLLVDGLLQTDDYARALLYGDEAAVAARMGRQTVLAREDSSPPLLVCVLGEIVLWHQVGAPKVMHDQLMHLIASISDRVSVQPGAARDSVRHRTGGHARNHSTPNVMPPHSSS
jgi:hypothetical protein